MPQASGSICGLSTMFKIISSKGLRITAKNLRRTSIWSIACCALLLSGCGKQRLMNTPEVFIDTDIDPFAQVIPERRNARAHVLIASGRMPTGSERPDEYYGKERSHVLRLGMATVDIGGDMPWDSLKRVSLARDRSQSPFVTCIGYEEFGILWTTVAPPEYNFDPNYMPAGVSHAPAQRFLDTLHKQLSLSISKNIYIFVHGFNTEFSHNTGMAAEIWHYLGRDGAILSYAWPSEHNILSYEVDKANAAYSTRHFRKLLLFLADQSKADTIHIIAHSAGNPIVVNTLRDLRLIHFNETRDSLQRRLRIGRILLAAPDMDLDQMINAELDGFEDCAQHAAIYASKDDIALDLSAVLSGDKRVGSSVGELTHAETIAIRAVGNFDWIDVTSAEEGHGTTLGHSYFHKNPWVSSDIALYIKFGILPADRGLVRDSGSAFWTFPKEYRSQSRSIAKKAYAALGDME